MKLKKICAVDDYRCPACGSTKIKREKINVVTIEPFGKRNLIKGLSKMTCLNHPCDCTGDFFNENDKIIEFSLRRN